MEDWRNLYSVLKTGHLGWLFHQPCQFLHYIINPAEAIFIYVYVCTLPLPSQAGEILLFWFYHIEIDSLVSTPSLTVVYFRGKGLKLAFCDLHLIGNFGNFLFYFILSLGLFFWGTHNGLVVGTDKTIISLKINLYSTSLCCCC